MTFSVIKRSNSETRAMDGYRFIGKVQTDKTESKEEAESWWNKEIDSFYDGWETICKGEDGKLYLVGFGNYSQKPLIWCEVEEI